MMNGYLSQLKGNNEFVTLTIPNVYAENLEYTCRLLTKTMSLIIRNFREKRGIHLSGIRKIEVTYNSITNTFHPHLHLIVNEGGQMIIDEWLKRFPGANRIAQDVRIANQESLNELFKYTTKIIGHKNGEYIVYTKALDVIMTSLYKKRCFQPFGIIRKVSEEVDEELQAQVYESLSYDNITWIWNDCDWVDNKKNTLTGYISPDVDFTYV